MSNQNDIIQGINVEGEILDIEDGFDASDPETSDDESLGNIISFQKHLPIVKTEKITAYLIFMTCIVSIPLYT